MGKSHLGHHHLIIEYLQIGVMELLNIKIYGILVYIRLYVSIRGFRKVSIYICLKILFSKRGSYSELVELYLHFLMKVRPEQTRGFCLVCIGVIQGKLRTVYNSKPN